MNNLPCRFVITKLLFEQFVAMSRCVLERSAAGTLIAKRIWFDL